MKFNKQHFCSLVSVHEFHQMLFNMDSAFYGRFLQEIKKHTGCGGNVKSVEWLLEELQATPSKLQIVLDWMSAHAPHVVHQEQQVDPIHEKLDAAFSSDIHTIPRRKKVSLDQLESFLLTTIKHEVKQVGNLAYVEYLNEQDRGFLELINDSRWYLKNL
jgi:hypothetical protein